METWSWVVVIVALVLLGAGTLRFDLLLPAVRERLGGRPDPQGKRGPLRAVPGGSAPHGHAAAAHTGHVAPHGAVRRRPAGLRGPRHH